MSRLMRYLHSYMTACCLSKVARILYITAHHIIVKVQFRNLEARIHSDLKHKDICYKLSNAIVMVSFIGEHFRE